MKPNDVVKEICELIRGINWIPGHARVEASSRFVEDLEMDDLDRIEVVMMVEEFYGVEVPEADLEGVDTVGKLAQCFIRRLDQKQNGGAR